VKTAIRALFLNGDLDSRLRGNDRGARVSRTAVRFRGNDKTGSVTQDQAVKVAPLRPRPCYFFPQNSQRPVALTALLA